eukprot:TRINITY_DN107913_c0_g1_i1.p2 TRINITY_DN107913_c0_g1~~TRINITY_DN107913_c0_g1_i1.p2  ORF type:complete len:149 (-),score=15.03 TRINITY_DN107913_c0_g1_i1:297-743(-)
MYRKVEVQAKVNVMMCAIAKAYAAIDSNEATGTAVAQMTACKEAGKPATAKSPKYGTSCECRKWGDQPQGCGKHGRSGASDDYICYVRDPATCPCAQNSLFYSGQKWRYCGQTLGEMQLYLNTQDNKNGVQPTPEGFAFCNIDSRLDT